MKILRIILILAVLGGLGYMGYQYFANGSTSAPTSSLVSSNTDATTPESDANAVSDTFLQQLLNLKSITIDTDLFNTTTYKSLHDYSMPIVSDGTEGRVNPFAPIGTDATAATPVPVAPTQQPTLAVTTNQPGSITRTSALLVGTIPVGATISGIYFEYTTSASPTAPMAQTTHLTAAAPATGIFTFSLTGLTPNTIYHVRAVADVGGALFRGQTLQFKTLR